MKRVSIRGNKPVLISKASFNFNQNVHFSDVTGWKIRENEICYEPDIT